MTGDKGRSGRKRIGVRETVIVIALTTLAFAPREAPIATNGDPGEDAGGQEPARPGVRPLDADAARLIGEARFRSPTIARFLKELERSDVVVYLRLRLMPRCGTGRMTLLGAAGRLRYLKIDVAATRRAEEAIGWLGHELRHALEVASAADVHDQATLETLYRRIGGGRTDPMSRYETDAAIEARRTVLAEVRASAGNAEAPTWVRR